eukprot:TRINITY_DN161242_c0_g2_i2.p1 TRINITY_DN161242_c0_g2~~TRINITY_DN161242_c0_g2_i2.p1  ORF type:complete len:291 (+),score=95.72 TRINITY_DN161242_c0_g2_i2:57-929(+)
MSTYFKALKASFQVLGGSDESQPAVVFSVENGRSKLLRRLLIQTPEGCRRLCGSKHVKLKQLTDIVLLDGSVESTSGIAGLLYGLAEISAEKINIIGPESCDSIVQTAKEVICRQYPQIHFNSLGKLPPSDSNCCCKRCRSMKVTDDLSIRFITFSDQSEEVIDLLEDDNEQSISDEEESMDVDGTTTPPLSPPAQTPEEQLKSKIRNDFKKRRNNLGNQVNSFSNKFDDMKNRFFGFQEGLIDFKKQYGADEDSDSSSDSDDSSSSSSSSDSSSDSSSSDSSDSESSSE